MPTVPDFPSSRKGKPPPMPPAGAGYECVVAFPRVTILWQRSVIRERISVLLGIE